MPRLRANLYAFAATLLAGTLFLPAASAQQGAAQAQPAASAPDDGSLTRADFIATMDSEFRNRDADNDGILTLVELKQYEIRLARAAALNQNRQIFVRLDLDRNGGLSPNEFAALVGQPPAPDVTPQMKVLDQNRDGNITIIEHRAAKLVNFDVLDTDFNGIVTDAEMQAAKVPKPGPSGH